MMQIIYFFLLIHVFHVQRNLINRDIFIIVVNENVSLVISRQVLTDVSNRLMFLPDEISKAVSHYTLDKVNFILPLIIKR